MPFTVGQDALARAHGERVFDAVGRLRSLPARGRAAHVAGGVEERSRDSRVVSEIAQAVVELVGSVSACPWQYKA